MPLWCIIHSSLENDPRVWLQENGATAIYGRLHAARAGFKLEDGETTQTFEIAPEAARKIPKDMIGPVLQGGEVEWLMKLISKTTTRG